MLKKFFKDSETILLARLQVLVGAVAAALTFVKPEVLAPVLPTGFEPWLVVAHGIALEYLRRRRATDL